MTSNEQNDYIFMVLVGADDMPAADMCMRAHGHDPRGEDNTGDRSCLPIKPHGW